MEKSEETKELELFRSLLKSKQYTKLRTLSLIHI